MEWLQGIFAPVTQWLKNRQAIAQAKHELRKSVINNKARLAQSTQDNNHAWEMANLEDKDKTLRIASFSMFALPMILTAVSPEHGGKIFENLKVVPDWYKQSFIMINGGIWGIVELKHGLPSLISGVKQAIGKKG